MSDKRYIVVACEIMYRELCACAARSNNPVDLHFVEQALHDVGNTKMPIELQKKIDEIDTSNYDAILLCYGLCNNGVCGLRADIPIVIPRAHDCITLFMGSKEGYLTYFNENHGTMFGTSSWIELSQSQDFNGNIFSEEKYREYVEEYGEEAAEYIKETLGNFEGRYQKYAFINTGVGDVEGNRAKVIQKAEELGWSFEELEGDKVILQRLVDGRWDDDMFLVVEPGNTIAPSYNEAIVKSVPLA